MNSSVKNKVAVYMDAAEAVAQRSPDAETKVGAVLVNNNTGAILATGYNGFVRGAKDEELPNTRPEKYEYMIHAEQNLISNCARHGISTDNCTLVCTMTPCKSCMRMLINTGITKIISKNLYKDFKEILEMRDVCIDLDYDQENNFYVIQYRPR